MNSTTGEDPRTTASQHHTAARAMLRALANRGVRIAFGIPGGLIGGLFDALVDVPEITLITTRHEGMAAYAAMGHAAATGMPAIVLTTGGPGITNAITGVAAAFAEELPMILIGGEVPASARGRGALQDSTSNSLDAVSMLRTITRASMRVEGGALAAGVAEQAFRIATGARPGPVFVSVPLDVGKASTVAPRLALDAGVTSRPDGAACAAVADALRRAQRPLLIAGNGARAAATELRLLAERLAIPVVTTPHAKGVFPESHPLHHGGIGFAGHPSASAYLASKPDVVCILGSRLGDIATNGWTLPLQGTDATFHVDRDPAVIGRNYPVTLGLVADCAAALRAIAQCLPSDVAIPQRECGIRRIPASASAMHPAKVLAWVQSAFPDAIYTSDQGEHCAFALHYLAIDEPDQFRAMVGFGSMGSGIGSAIGIQCARPERRVVAICGDGGLAMHAGEILTCVENGIAVVFVVFNDGKFNMVNHGLKADFGKVPANLPSLVADLAAAARGLGAIGVRVDDLSTLPVEKLRELAALGRPVVLDVRIDADVALSVSSRSASLRPATLGGAS